MSKGRPTKEFDIKVFQDLVGLGCSQEEISADNYEKPESDKLRCPLCGGIDEKIRFVKV